VSDPKETLVRVSVRVDAPPSVDGTAFGLQDKAGSLHGGAALPDGSRLYTCDIRAVASSGGGGPNFLGPFTHGTRAARHLYLGHRGSTGGEPPWIKRIKVPLAGISWSLIERSKGRLATRVDGRASATVHVQWTPDEET
jgi:hypothetical protein